MFTWIDHSETDRRRMLDAIALFRPRDTRDELGLGTIRDGFADAMFPGTGSLQTRARYFFFVPWMYSAFERDGVRSAEIGRRARQLEVRLINALAESDDNQGTIGIQKRAALQRLPSSIYWNGLKRLGIRRFPGSQEDYHSTLDDWHRRQRRSTRNDDGESIDSPQANWRPGLPPAPDAFPDTARFELSVREAEYLEERILSEEPSSVLAFFVRHLTSESETDFVWEHPLAGELPAPLTRQVLHAQNFAEVMHGAAILYNIMLADAEPRREALISGLRDQFTLWHEGLEARRNELHRWDRGDFWRHVRDIGTVLTEPTQRFVDSWIDLVRAARNLPELLDSRAARDTIEEREYRLKRGLARLRNRDARQRWNGNSGLNRLEYRWRNAQILLNDMLAAGDSHA